MVRKFKGTTATRDDDSNKIDLEAILSPSVLLKYSEYMNRHRKMSDGTTRDGDNWQSGFGDKHFDVCMKSLMRHVFDMWVIHRGGVAREDMDSAINGVLFNTMAYYDQFIKNNNSK